MPGLVPLHRRKHRPAARIPVREKLQMAVQVLDHLTLGFGQEAETPTVPGKAGDGNDRERPGVPDWIEQALPATQLGKTLLRLGQVIDFLRGRRCERLLSLRVPCRQCLSLV